MAENNGTVTGETNGTADGALVNRVAEQTAAPEQPKGGKRGSKKDKPTLLQRMLAHTNQRGSKHATGATREVNGVKTSAVIPGTITGFTREALTAAAEANGCKYAYTFPAGQAKANNKGQLDAGDDAAEFLEMMQEDAAAE